MFWLDWNWVEAHARRKIVRAFSEVFSREASSEARGLRLLKNWLTSEQRAQFEARRYFDVIGCHTGRHYRIHYGTANNVHLLDTEGPIVGRCFVPIGHLVAGDVMLSQKIALETNELAALAVAQSFLPQPAFSDTSALGRLIRILNLKAFSVETISRDQFLSRVLIQA